MSELTTRQQKFVDNYALCGVGSKAAIAAGYSEGSAEQQASRLLTKDKVKDALAVREEGLAKLADIADQEIIAAIKREIQDDSPQVRLKALDMLAKIKGLYADKNQGNTGTRVTFTLNLGGEEDSTDGEVVEGEIVGNQ